jgi:hypothetical protein
MRILPLGRRGGDGNVLTEPGSGLCTVDFYGAYRDQAIADSLAKLQARAPSRDIVLQRSARMRHTSRHTRSTPDPA